MKETRVPTHIAGFDSLIKGGFKQKSINLIIGGAGTGKTIFAVQFLVNGIINNGETAVYITFEERKEKLYSDVLGFGWDLAKYEKQGKFIFLQYNPEQVKKVLIEGGGTIENIISRSKAKRLVIDSITSFSLLYKDELTRKEAALSLFELINSWGCTAVLTAQQMTVSEEIFSTTLEFEVDSLIRLYTPKKKGIRKRAFEILKMRGTSHPLKTMEMSITDKGIRCDPNKIVDF
ncbi:MAG TPA: ATPase domain-containing protein [Candidatus Nanoarchaeia archaeon]|nr:ATPase domain-containing protein [Candidatus Nanoarchaeia archaeon]